MKLGYLIDLIPEDVRFPLAVGLILAAALAAFVYLNSQMIDPDEPDAQD